MLTTGTDSFRRRHGSHFQGADLRGSQLPDLDPTLDLRGALVTVEQAVAFAVSLGLDVGPAADTEV